jgi:hypothetical protein
MHDMSHLVEFFRREGYAVLRKIFTRGQVEACIGHLSAARQRQRHIVYNLIESDPELFLTLAANSSVLEFCELVMGPFIQLDGLTIVGLPPKDPDGTRRVAGWHRDPWAWVPPCSSFVRPLAINALLYLQDLTEKTGPMRVIPGSHRKVLTLSPSERRQKHAMEVPLHLEWGDVIMIHNSLVHTGTSPSPEISERAFVSIFYNHSWLKQSVVLDGSQAARLFEVFRQSGDRRMLRLLGDDETLMARNDTGFLQNEEEQWAGWVDEDKRRLVEARAGRAKPTPE